MIRSLLKWIGADISVPPEADVYVRFNNAPAGWAVFLIVLAIVSYVVWNYWREDQAVGVVSKVCLGVIRCLALLLILLILFEPVIVVETKDRQPSMTLVLIDTSESMNLSDFYTRPKQVQQLRDALGHKKVKQALDSTGELLPRPRLLAAKDLDQDSLKGVRRLDIVNALLRGPTPDAPHVLHALQSKKNQLQFYTFAAKTSLLTGSGDDGTPAAILPPLTVDKRGGGETRLGEALRYVFNKYKGQPVSAVVVISDGRNNAGSVSPRAAASHARARNIPIFTVGIGNPDPAKDLRVVDVEGPPVVFAGQQDSITVKVGVRNEGYGGQSAQLILREGERQLASKTITLAEAAGRQVVELHFPAPGVGRHQIDVVLEPFPDEFNRRNNRETYELEVKDRSLRVLYVDGRPRWEYRYLRQALTRDETIEAAVLLQTGPETFWAEGNVKLDGFPTTERDLFAYDVLILGDVDLAAFTHEQLGLIKKFVDTGGGLLLLAGERHMPADMARNRILAPLLPVLISGNGSMGMEETITESFRPVLTAEGRRHPAMRLHDDPEQNKEIWYNLPGLFWYYPADKARPAATVLAVHPTDTLAGGGRRPLVVMQYYGAGRTMFVGVDSLWRWRYLVGDAYTFRFYSQAILYLAAGKSLGKLRNVILALDQTEYVLGQEVTLRLNVKDRDYKPITKPSIELSLRAPGRDPIPVRLDALPGGRGEYEQQFLPPERGLYSIIYAGEASGGEPVELGQFRVRTPRLERHNPRLDEELLRTLADEGGLGGRYVPIDEFASLAKTIRPRERVIPHPKEFQLFDRWPLFVLFCCLIISEWIWRRRVRLL